MDPAANPGGIKELTQIHNSRAQPNLGRDLCGDHPAHLSVSISGRSRNQRLTSQAADSDVRNSVTPTDVLSRLLLWCVHVSRPPIDEYVLLIKAS